MNSILKTALGVFVVLIFVTPARAGDEYILDDQVNEWKRPEPEAEVERGGGVVSKASSLIAEEEFDEAEDLLGDYLEEHPNASDRKEALYLYGSCAFGKGRYYKAHQRYQEVIDRYPQTEEYALSLKRDLDIASAWLDGKKRLLWGFIPVGAEDEALHILSQIEELAHGYRIAEVAVKKQADYYYRTGQFELARQAYRRLVKEYESSHYMETAMFRCGSSSLAMFPGVSFDATDLIEAKELFREYSSRFPGQARDKEAETLIDQIEAKRAEKEYKTGRFYVRVDKPRAAAYYFNYVMSNWPGSLWAGKAKADLERLGFKPGAPVE